MNQYFYLIILLHFCLCRRYIHLDKDKPLSFELEGDNLEYGAYLDYDDIYEEDDKFEGNAIYFLKISEELNVNCIITNKDQEPEEETLNKDTSNEYCRLNISLLNDNKLIDFPKKIEKEKRLYFLFFIEKKDGFFLSTSVYEVRRVPFPKLIKINDYRLELNESETNIYLMKESNEFNDNYRILSTLSNISIPIYAYSNKNFEYVGYIGENNYVFQFNKSVILDNNCLYIIIDNNEEEKKVIKFSYNENIHLFTANANGYIQLTTDTIFSLLQIQNQEKKLIKFSFKNYNTLRVLDDDREDMINILDESFYEYIPSRYYYLSKNYYIFLITSEIDSNFTIEMPDLSQFSSNIEIENFIYFQILKENEFNFTVKYPEYEILIKLISTNYGQVSINGIIYSFTSQNQIEKIDNKNNEILNIKALDNDFIFAIRSYGKISLEFISIGGEYHVPGYVSGYRYSTFASYDVDMNKDNEYISFSLGYMRPSSSIKPKYTTDFGLINNLEISENEDYTYYDSYPHIIYYNLKYYKKKYKKESIDLRKIFYFTDLPEYSLQTYIRILSCYNKELILKENEFIKMNVEEQKENYISPINRKKTVFMITAYGGSIITVCPGMNYEKEFDGEIFYTFDNKEINCFFYLYSISVNMDFYAYIQSLEEDDEKYTFEPIINENTELKVINKDSIELSFNYNISNSTQINYTFFITDSKNWRIIYNRVDVFENFYLNNNYNESEYEIYKFDFKDLSLNLETGTVNLPIPTKFDIKDKNKTFNYRLIAEVLPIKAIHLYERKEYKFHDEYIPDEEEETGEEDETEEEEEEEEKEEEEEEKEEEEEEEEEKEEKEEEEKEEEEEEEEKEEEEEEKEEEEEEEEEKEEEEEEKEEEERRRRKRRGRRK